MDKQQQYSIGYFVVALVLMLLAQSYFATTHQENLSYDQFKTLLRAGKLDDVSLTESMIAGAMKPDGLDEVLPQGKLDELKRFGEGEHRFVTVRVEDPNLVTELEAA